MLKKKLGILVIILLFALPSLFIFSQTVNVLTVTVKTRLNQCEDSVDNDGDFLIDFSNDPQCDSSLDDDENVTGTEVHATKDFTVSGGTFSFNNADGLPVDFYFPPDFYSTSTRLFVNSYANDFFVSSKPASGDLEFVGKTYDILLYDIQTQTEIASTSKNITITFRYKDSDVPASTSEDTIAPYKWGNTDTGWQLIPGAILDKVNNTVQFEVSSFGGTSFVLFAAPPIPTPTPEVTPLPYPASFIRRIIEKIPFIPKEKPPKPPPTLLPADFNNDGRVNLQDLSILLYWWGKDGEHDLSGDGKVGIEDVSILFYYWTG